MATSEGDRPLGAVTLCAAAHKTGTLQEATAALNSAAGIFSMALAINEISIAGGIAKLSFTSVDGADRALRASSHTVVAAGRSAVAAGCSAVAAGCSAVAAGCSAVAAGCSAVAGTDRTTAETFFAIVNTIPATSAPNCESVPHAHHRFGSAALADNLLYCESDTNTYFFQISAKNSHFEI
jgi:hypothetical protein